jgi:hypothetical protein
VNPTNFLTELKRRNVYRAAVASTWLSIFQISACLLNVGMRAKSGLMAACSTQFGLCAYKQNPLHRTSLKRAEFGGFVVTLAIFDLISDDFTYKKRRGRAWAMEVVWLVKAATPFPRLKRASPHH